MAIKSYADLEVWREAMDLAADVYRLALRLPKTEQYGMSSQLQRAAASVPANIAEGFQRGTRKDYARLVGIARGSLAEVETFLQLAVRVGHLDEPAIQPLLDRSNQLGRRLTRLKQRLESPSKPD